MIIRAVTAWCGLSEVALPTTCVGYPLSGGESAQGTPSGGAEGSLPSQSTIFLFLTLFIFATIIFVGLLETPI